MTRTDWFKGVFPALVTPFTSHETVDEEGFRKLIQHVLPHVDGLVPCGTTGEFVYLSMDEKKRLIDIAIEESGGKPVIAGTGCASTMHTIELTKYARDAGAKAALVVSPFYIGLSYKELYQHYDSLNYLDFPIIMYNIPQCTGVHKKWWTAEGIAYLENIIGIKDSSGDMPFLMSLFEKIKDRISIICGHDEIGMAALGAGADGVILASANLIPDIWQQIYSAIQSGDTERARKLQAGIQKLVRIVVRCGANQAVKEGLTMMGIPVGNGRRPTMPGGSFKREDREELRLALEDLGKIPRKMVKFQLDGHEPRDTSYPVVPRTPEIIGNLTMKVGEAFAGPPAHEVAHIDLLLGMCDGPVGRAITHSVERQEKGGPRHKICEKPLTLLVPTVTARTLKQKENVHIHAKDGIVMAIEKSIRDGVLPEFILQETCMIVNVFVHPAATNRKRIKFNNYKAMLHAIRKALEDRPGLDELLREKECARHPFKYSP